MRELMTVNCYDVGKTLVIFGTCLPRVAPNSFKQLEVMGDTLLSLCLEKQHLNMALSKVIAILARNEDKIKKIVFASVDRSPHCVQLHYMLRELQISVGLQNIEVENYVSVNDKLIKISLDTIELSKSLARLQGSKK